jgi:hypothetical protein
VSTKVLVISLAMPFVDIMKWSGSITDSLFPSMVHFKKLLKLTFFRSNNSQGTTTEHNMTEQKTLTGSSLVNHSQTSSSSL